MKKGRVEDFDFVPTPFIESIVKEINEHKDEKESFSFKMTNNDAVWYLRNFRKEIIKYIKESTTETVKITVRSNGINIKIIRKCNLCDGTYDFRRVLISDWSGVQLSNCLEQVKDYNRFIYCPKCGKKLTWLNFGGNKNIMGGNHG